MGRDGQVDEIEELDRLTILDTKDERLSVEGVNFISNSEMLRPLKRRQRDLQCATWTGTGSLIDSTTSKLETRVSSISPGIKFNS